MLNYRNKLGLLALVLGVTALSGCGGGGDGTGTDQVNFPSCQDPEVLQPGGGCGLPRDPFEVPDCPNGQIRNSLNVCVAPNFPAPSVFPAKVDGVIQEAIIYVNIDGSDNERFTEFNKYNLHLWQDCGGGWGNSITDGTNTTYSIPTTWPNGPRVSSKDQKVANVDVEHDPYYGAFFRIPISAAGTCGNFLIKLNPVDGTPQTNDFTISLKRDGSTYDAMGWVIINKDNMRNSTFSTIPTCLREDCSLERPITTIAGLDAHWIDRDTIVWNKAIGGSFKAELYHSAAAGISANEAGDIIGSDKKVELSSARAMTQDEQNKFPHLSTYTAYDLPTEGPNAVTLDDIKTMLKGELVMFGRYNSQEEDEDGNDITVVRGYATRLQLPGALDDIYTSGPDNADEANLGVSYENGVGVSLWAPTAQNVELRVYSGDPLRLTESIPMQFDSATGIWSYTGTEAQLHEKYYRFRVTVYNAVDQRVRRLEVTDPYSVSLSTDGRHSQFVDLNDPDLKPEGWDDHEVPAAGEPENYVIYETHVRDFSAMDASTPKTLRGKYLAFTLEDTAPVNHLKSLVEAGLTHIHFLPTYNGANILEGVGATVTMDSYIFELCQRVPDATAVSVCDGSIPNSRTVRQVFESLDADTAQARDLVRAIERIDGFNWGYDPVHFNAPEGSYATDSQGYLRIKEKRAMIMALHKMGLRSILDVVYPHTLDSGNASPNAVFDKIVPGYYQRVNLSTGIAVGDTFAGSDTATENRMMAKLVKDSLLLWTEHYKVDGFRFDQSGYMPKAVLLESYEAVKAIDPDNYFYAEAWNPQGTNAAARIGTNNLATQSALAGSGVGTFNDRIRDRLRYFDLFAGRNVDAVRAGLAGNLVDFKIKAKNGAVIPASAVGAYNQDPQEAVNYVEKHDNDTLWDWMHRPDAIPVDTSIDNRVRMHALTLSIPVLSQGVPFIHMGSDLLRSKSMDANSYNSGDWFNFVDFTKQTNNWAVGLPPRANGMPSDEQILAAFNNPNSKPSADHIELSSELFKEMLAISKSSPLFSLQTAEEVYDRVGFHDGGRTQQDGLIVMSIDDGVGIVEGTDDEARDDLDPSVDAIVVVINGTDSSKSVVVPTATGFTLHEIQQESVDTVVADASFAEAEEGDLGGSFTVPAFTTAVFVKVQEDAEVQGEGLSSQATISLPDQDPPPYANDVYVRGSVYDGGWSAVDGNKMTYHGGKVYSWVRNLNPGPYEFKLAASDWNATPNFGGTSGTTTPVTLGTGLVLTSGGSSGNLGLTIAEAGLYRFELDASSSVDAPTLTVVKELLNGETVYLRGSVTGAGWDASALNQMNYAGKGIYAISVDLDESETPYQFKIANSTWSTINLGNGAAIDVNEEAPLSQGGDNISITINTSATYKFELNMQDPDVPTVRVYADNFYSSTPIYVRGSVYDSDWSATDDNQLSYAGNGEYKLTLNLAAQGYQFKIADGNWSVLNFGGPEGTTTAVTLGEALSLTSGGSSGNLSLNITEAGDYVFTLNTANPDISPTVTVDSAE